MKNDIIAGLDIGSTAIRLVVGQIGRTAEDDPLQIIGAVTVPAQGINKGAVKSIEDVTSSISACLEKAERLIGVPIQSVWVGLNSPHMKCERSRGVVAIGKSDGEINQDDIERALEAARALSVPPNYEILHVIPVKFTVDNQEDIKDPIGMVGVRLEVETLIIQGLSSQIKNLTKAIYHTRLDIEDLVLSDKLERRAFFFSQVFFKYILDKEKEGLGNVIAEKYTRLGAKLLRKQLNKKAYNYLAKSYEKFESKKIRKLLNNNQNLIESLIAIIQAISYSNLTLKKPHKFIIF